MDRSPLSDAAKLPKRSLRSWLEPLSIRLQWRRALYGVLVSMWLALLGALLVLGGSRLWPLPGWRLWATLALALWVLAHLVRFPFLRPSDERTARQLDRELHLKERLFTALELEQRGLNSRLTQAQQEDALDQVQAVDPVRALPWRVPRRALTAAAGLLVGALLLFFLPNPQDVVLQKRAALRQEAEAQAAELEALAEKVAALEQLSPEEREELLRTLDEAAERLRDDPEQVEEVVADLEAVREALRQSLEERQAYRAAVDETEELLRDLAGELAQGNEAALEAALAGLEALPELLEGMSEEEIAELARQLVELAQRAAADPELAQAMESLAQALQAADPEALAQATAAMAAALEQSAAEVAAQAEVEATLEQALETLDEAAAASASAAEGAGDEREASTGTGSGADGSGSGAEEGSGEGEGENSGGSWHQDPNRAQEGESNVPGEEVYVPLGPDGQPAYVPGEVDGLGGDDLVVLPSIDPEQGGEGAAVPYDAVYPYYHEAADQAMERSYIPPGMRDYVRAYFSGLEP